VEPYLGHGVVSVVVASQQSLGHDHEGHIWRHDPRRAAARTLDFTRPVGLMLLGILGHIEDDEEARSIVERLMDALPQAAT
jgi:hypothetical protein